MPKGVIGDSASDRATDKMEKMMDRSTSKRVKPLTLLEQFKKRYPNTWKKEIEIAKTEQFVKKSF
jgi:uncharacterized membrane protein